MKLNHETIVSWLQETDKEKLEELYTEANKIRKEMVGDEVHLRGLIEFSSYCSRKCTYCGLNSFRTDISRYRMNRNEILSCAKEAEEFGYGTVVLQSGEDYGITTTWMENLIQDIKNETSLAITLSLGERSDEELEIWRKAGADRYLLRFETSNPELYQKIHPDVSDEKIGDRMTKLQTLRKLGYEVGSGVMIGIPGQTWDMLAQDIEMFKELNLDMIGVGPFISHKDTPLGKKPEFAPQKQQVPNNEEMAYKVIALTRIICPKANIPSTTAIATLNKASGRENGLNRGANILMPNMTPRKYRALYEIYPAKACLDETSVECRGCMSGRIKKIGRTIGKGRGDSKNHTKTAINQKVT